MHLLRQTQLAAPLLAFPQGIIRYQPPPLYAASHPYATITTTTHLRMDVHLGSSATMPGCQQHTASSALVLDILERVHNVWDTSQAAETAETQSPGMRSISRLKRRVGHAPLPARGTIRRRRPAVQVGNGRRALVLLAAGLLRRHAGLLGVHALLLRLHIGRVGVLLRGRRADGVLLGRRGGRAELLLWWVLGILRLLLLLVLGVGVLVVDGRLLLWLAGHVGRHGRLRVLLHGDTLLLHFGGCVGVS